MCEQGGHVASSVSEHRSGWDEAGFWKGKEFGFYYRGEGRLLESF